MISWHSVVLIVVIAFLAREIFILGLPGEATEREGEQAGVAPSPRKSASSRSAASPVRVADRPEGTA